LLAVLPDALLDVFLDALLDAVLDALPDVSGHLAAPGVAFESITRPSG